VKDVNGVFLSAVLQLVHSFPRSHENTKKPSLSLIVIFFVIFVSS